MYNLIEEISKKGFSSNTAVGGIGGRLSMGEYPDGAVIAKEYETKIAKNVKGKVSLVIFIC